jgi:hypothetical protein
VGLSTILARGSDSTSAQQSRAIAQTSTPVSPRQNTGEFWREFLRVQCDKFILLALILFLWKIGRFDDMKYVIGGLIVAINHNRFRWS